MKRLLSFFLCLSLLLGCLAPLAEAGTGSAPRANVTDTDAPNIISVKFAEKGKTLKPGDKLHVQMKVEDRSDITVCTASFFNQSGNKRIEIRMAYDASLDMYTGEYTLRKSDFNGEYVLFAFGADDIHSNFTSFRIETKKGFGSFKLKGATNGLKVTAKIKENGKTVKPGEIIHLSFKLSRNYPGVFWLYYGLYNENGYVVDYSIPCSPTTTSVETEFSFSKQNRNGKYTLNTVALLDDKWDPVADITDLAGQTITLSGASKPNSGPKLSSVSLKEKKKTMGPGDTIHVSAKVKTSSGIDFAEAYLVSSYFIDCIDTTNHSETWKSTYSMNFPLSYNSSTKKLEGSYKLPKNIPNGQYYLMLNVSDTAWNHTANNYTNLYFTFNGPDYVDEGMSAFITTSWNALWGKSPSAAEINKYGMLLANGKQKAVDIIKTLMSQSGLSGETAAEALWQIMQGKDPSDTEKAKTVQALNTSLDYGIDSLNNAVFRQRCKDWGIKPGNLGTGAADTKVATVDVDGGHYTLNGSKATLTGVTDKNIKKLIVKDTVSANGKTYKVTQIDKAACRGLKKLTTVTIGKNVTSIGAEAFNGCKKLKTITVNATNLKKVGTNAFAGIKNSATFKCPKKKLSKYEKLIREKGSAPKKAKFK